MGLWIPTAKRRNPFAWLCVVVIIIIVLWRLSSLFFVSVVVLDPQMWAVRPGMSPEAAHLVRLSARMASEIAHGVRQSLARLEKREQDLRLAFLQWHLAQAKADNLELNERLDFHFLFPMWDYTFSQDSGQPLGVFISCPQVFAPSLFDNNQAVPFPPPSSVRGKSFLEMGCGTGYNAVLAARYGASRVVAADFSPAAVSCAAKNAAFAGVAMETRISNVFSAFGEDERFDLIYWNIPWGHEDAASQDSGHLLQSAVSGGRGLLHSFLRDGAKHLTPQGSLFLVTCLESDSAEDKECMRRAEFEEIVHKFGWKHSTERYVRWSAKSGLYLKRLSIATAE